MWLTNKITSAILQLQSGKASPIDGKNTFKEVFAMLYESLNELEERNELYGVSPLSYVALGCARWLPAGNEKDKIKGKQTKNPIEDETKKCPIKEVFLWYTTALTRWKNLKKITGFPPSLMSCSTARDNWKKNSLKDAPAENLFRRRVIFVVSTI